MVRDKKQFKPKLRNADFYLEIYFRLMKTALFLSLIIWTKADTENAKQPNIVYILADDLGWSDVNWNNKLGFQKLLES